MGLLDGRVAVVTGAGRGIGRATARALAANGASVALLDVDEGIATEAADDVGGSTGQPALGLQVDVRSPEQAMDAIGKCVLDFGRVDIMVNNAGIVRAAMMHKMSLDEWQQVLDVHSLGTLNFMQAVYPHFKEQQSGRIINVTSSAGLIGTIGQINYAAAKGAIAAMTKSAALEMARFNVTSNAVSPGPTNTRITETVRSDPRFAEPTLKRIPLGRWGEPEDIAEPIVFLASDMARFITGQILMVDGGYLMR